MNMKIEGEPLKRWRVNYGGEHVADCDTAAEAWEEYRRYEQNIRPVTDRDKRYSYDYFDGRKKLDIVQFRNAVQAEKRAGNEGKEK
ncbi:hypothetical protein UP09_23765 [Bradyrhizobium sp. LTSP885]|uniref:hypothetical protein n=1 Tax=Bradyrhizobium sp. LTSP885 TaxID=1619232 RepID=UPI0005E78B45|nr:hypothetical protein [Bradyrhizobium sp. LTSP885]KJC40068.1 hypothetical protein UP09_23765 [Bradyrhizobium sp. LTSP885]